MIGALEIPAVCIFMAAARAMYSIVYADSALIIAPSLICIIITGFFFHDGDSSLSMMLADGKRWVREGRKTAATDGTSS